MADYKRALALVLRLFLVSLPLLYALEDQGADKPQIWGDVSSSTGTLWVEDEGAAGYWRSGISAGIGKQAYGAVDLGQVMSNLPWVNGSVFGGWGTMGFDTPWAGIDFNAGFFNQSPLILNMDTIVLESEGGQGLFFRFEMPIHIGKLNISPSFLYGQAAWDKGSLYWFFGKPDIPALYMYGLSAQYGEHHTLGFRYASMNMNIMSNEEESLFDSTISAYILHYQFSWKKSNLHFTGVLGWLYAAAVLDGALTASNQHYVAFPFLTIHINGAFGAHAGYGIFGLKLKHSIFQYYISLGAVHIFQDRGNTSVYYKMKKLFGGTEDSWDLPLDIGGIGAAFMLLDLGTPSLRLGNKKNITLSLGLQKVFALPWGYEKLFPNSSGSSSSSGSASENLPVFDDKTAGWIKTIALSGISLYGSLRW